jgi:nitroreductase
MELEDLEDLVKARRMCRDFSADPVDPAVVDRLVELARRAPSAGHTQGWAFLVLEGADQTRRFWEADASPQWLASPSLPGLVRAPVIIVAWASRQAYERRYAEADKATSALAWSVPYWIVDASFATMHILLGAQAYGLGALFFRLRPGAEEALREDFEVPDEWSAIGALALGFAAGGSGRQRPPRALRPVEQVVMRGGWRK